MTTRCRSYMLKIFAVIGGIFFLLGAIFNVREYFLVAIVCLMSIFSVLMTYNQFRRHSDGTLYVNMDDPEKDVFQIECNGTPDDWIANDDLLIVVDKTGGKHEP